MGSGANSYFFGFGATSGASAIIAGAALLLQGLYLRGFGKLLSPLQMRELLANPARGTTQGRGVVGNIGIMPNLRAIVQNTLGLAPDREEMQN